MSNQIITSSVTAVIRRSLVAGRFERLLGFLIRDNYRIVDLAYRAKVSEFDVEIVNCEAYHYATGEFLKSVEPFRLDRETIEHVKHHAVIMASAKEIQYHASKN